MKYALLAGVVAFLFGAFVPASAIPPPPLPVGTLKNGELVLAYPIVFVAGTDQMMTGCEEALHFVASYLRENPEVSLLRIKGHTDDDGGTINGQLLSEGRALVVARSLIKLGIDCKRLIAVGFGASKPIYDNSTPQRKAYDRRITLVRAALRGKPIGGLPVSGGGRMAGDLCAAQ